jgi:hypothetical protein
MNHWMWLVIVIPVVIWILSSVIRPPEEQPRDLRRRFPPRDDLGPGEPRPRPQGEVERFLEEINRLRSRSAEQQRAAEEPTAAPPPKPVQPMPRRVPRPVPPRRSRPEPVVRPELRESRPIGNLPLPVTAPPPPQVPALVVRPVLEVVDVVAASASARPVMPAPLLPTNVSPAEALRGMLQTPQTLAAAIVLHEILGPPRCRRRRP